jgi:hypothetical protein
MNVDDILRSGLHDLAEEATEVSDLHRVAVQRGRHRRSVRRAAAAGGAVLSVAALAGAAVVIANNTGGGSSAVITPLASDTSAAAPWWQTWTIGRHNGPLDPQFLAAAAPTYDGDTAPEPIDAYAGGTMPDGTQWVMFTDPHDGHVMQWLQGWNGAPDFGESTQTVTPDVTWTSWAIGTLAAHNNYLNDGRWVIVVGRPGTTSIDYSPDGSAWQPMTVEDGIGYLKTEDGFPPATAEVRLSDANGIYATGTPTGAGAGADQTDASDSPTATASATPSTTPTPTPTTP